MYYLYVGDPLPFPEGWRGPSVEERVKGWCWIVDQMKKDVWWTDEVAVSESQMVVKSWFSWPTSTHESLLPKAAALWHTCLSTSLIVRQTKSVSTHTQNTAKSLTLSLLNVRIAAVQMKNQASHRVMCGMIRKVLVPGTISDWGTWIN